MKQKATGMKAQGEIRQSQMLTTYGPGAMVDLPEYSVIVSGLEHWHGDKKRIHEPRLQARVAELLDRPEVDLYAPPIDEEEVGSPAIGVLGFRFPAWFVAQVEQTWESKTGKIYRTRPLVSWRNLDRGRYVGEARKRHSVVPVRFIQACPNGHISDINWPGFVHEFEGQCRGRLWLDEGGSGGDLSEIFIRCEACEARRPLSLAKLPQSKVLGRCQGERPWLGPVAAEECVKPDGEGPEFNRLLTRSASNAHFSQVLSVISIPEKDRKLDEQISAVWDDYLQYCEDARDVGRERRKDKVASALDGFSDAEVWARVAQRKSPKPPERKTIKQAEIERFLGEPSDLGDDQPEGDFLARPAPLKDLSPELAERLDRLVLVPRLKEVAALVGFTRFAPVMPDIDGELDLSVQRAALSLDDSWVPAVVNRGEGVFLSFKERSIREWLGRDEVGRREDELKEAFDEWATRKGLQGAIFPGAAYVMLHSLAHLLITAVALECGYGASSIRERIYAGQSGYGILLFTGSPGSEGTLGGLVDVGKDIGRHLRAALEIGRLCSNDPVCAQHPPRDVHEERYLHGAACHGCVLIAEPSCERRNEFLDRALVVPTVVDPNYAYFPGPV